MDIKGDISDLSLSIPEISPAQSKIFVYTPEYSKSESSTSHPVHRVIPTSPNPRISLFKREYDAKAKSNLPGPYIYF